MAAEFEGPRTAIVTGGARRIGAAIARALSADGWHVMIHCRRSEEEGRALAAELGNAAVVQADLASADAAEAIMRGLEGLPSPRLLVNSASSFEYDNADVIEPELWDRHMAVNLRAPVLLSRAFAAGASGGGLIVNMLDAKLSQLNADFFSYTISKVGLAGATELLARAFADRGIRVCGIAPAVTLMSGKQSREDFEAVHRLNPLGRGVEVEHIIAALRFLIATPTITGQTITVDAGQRFLALTRDVQYLEQT